MEECGMEMEELPMILREMYTCLPNILDPATKEDVIKAACHLASKRPNRVVDTILEVSVECDGALVADPYANLRIMKPLLKRLQDEDPITETTGRRNSKSIMPIAATNALSFILSLPDATDAIQNKFPQLLIALVTQIYFLLGASKRGNLFSFSKVELKAMFRQANIYLRRPDIREKTIGMVFFSELLYHPEVGNYFMMQDILDVLHKWMSQSYLLLQIFNKSLANEALRTLQFVFRHLDVETYGYQAISLIPHLLKYFPDDGVAVVIPAPFARPSLNPGVASPLSHLLSKEKAGCSLQNVDNIRSGLPDATFPPLAQVSRNALNACVAFMDWEEVPSDLFNYEMYSSPHSMYKDICAVIMNKCKQNISQMLDQMLDFLGNRRALYREAAAQLIALRDLEGDCEPSVAQVAAASVEELFRQCGHRINPDLVSSQLLAKVIGSISIEPSETQE
ncbi:hypothetical protein E2320_017909 [Naja naja]|nr:hypothetical protein E2320_017909 [Naja naja]